MTSEELGEVFEGDFADTCAKAFLLMLMRVQAEGLACTDPGARTLIGVSGNTYMTEGCRVKDGVKDEVEYGIRRQGVRTPSARVEFSPILTEHQCNKSNQSYLNNPSTHPSAPHPYSLHTT
jgi:hypothetical protein